MDVDDNPNYENTGLPAVRVKSMHMSSYLTLRLKASLATSGGTDDHKNRTIVCEAKEVGRLYFTHGYVLNTLSRMRLSIPKRTNRWIYPLIHPRNRRGVQCLLLCLSRLHPLQVT